MEEFALIKSRVNLNRVNLGIALISDLKVDNAAKSRHYVISDNCPSVKINEMQFACILCIQSYSIFRTTLV